MTTRRVGDELAHRARKPATVAEAFLFAVAEGEKQSREVTWPSPRWAADPAGFARDVLGVELWDRQVELCQAVRDHDRVSVASAHRCGKTTSAAALAIWWVCSFADSRAVGTAPTFRQVNAVWYREVRKLIHRSGRCVACKATDPKGPRPCPHSAVIPAYDGGRILHELATSGYKPRDGREIFGFAASTTEAFAGIADKNLLFIADEASGIDDRIFEALDGAVAGGAKVLLISNPTKRTGYLYDSHHSKRAFWGHVMTISALEVPNVVADRVIIPGLATRRWADRLRQEKGEKSAYYKIRVLGQFASIADGRTFPAELLDRAKDAWQSAPADGRLVIGIDPATETLEGDETAIAWRRGSKILAIEGHRGLTVDAIMVRVREIVTGNRRPGEIPLVVSDRGGGVGMRLSGSLREYADKREIDHVGVDPWLPATRKEHGAHKVRDELHCVLRAWLRAGGTLPKDDRLLYELEVVESFQSRADREQVTPKKEIRQLLGRSPDRADAVMLAVYPRAEVVDRTEDAPAPPPPPAAGGDRSSYLTAEQTFDPYQQVEWNR